MNAVKRITGAWRGSYSYDAAEENPKLNTVSFVLMLQQRWFGRFNGSVTDGPGGMPETGLIKGYISYPTIRFIKRMPVCYVGGPDGRKITLRQFLIEQGEDCDRDVPHWPIYYRGRFYDPHNANGMWIIRATPLTLHDGRAIQMPETTGSWTITRAR